MKAKTKLYSGLALVVPTVATYFAMGLALSGNFPLSEENTKYAIGFGLAASLPLLLIINVPYLRNKENESFPSLSFMFFTSYIGIYSVGFFAYIQALASI